MHHSPIISTATAERVSNQVTGLMTLRGSLSECVCVTYNGKQMCRGTYYKCGQAIICLRN